MFIDKTKIIFPIIIFLLGLISGLFINQDLIKKNVIPPQSTVNDQAGIKSDDQPIPWLDFSVTDFSIDDFRWGSVGNYIDGSSMSEYTQVALDNKSAYQSYPTTDITVKEYSSEIKPLKTRNFSEIMQEFSESNPEGILGAWETVIEENYKKYGSIATNYLPSDHISTLEEFDVDNDGIAETIISYNFVGRASGGSYRSDIIKGNNIIFSVQEDNSAIERADTANGFYVEWRSPDDFAPRCCPKGFKRTRFIFKDNKFIPLYEQRVIFMKVGKDNSE